MAATYPGEVADAARWSQAHPKVMGEQAVTLVADQPWDPSVQAMVAFPQVLAVMAQAPSWVQKLGDAYLAQPEDVLDAIQRLRRKAQQAGHLASNEYQTVGTRPQESASAASPAGAASAGTAPAEDYAEEIYIEPVDEELVYAPYYDPNEVYGTWEDEWYTPAYFVPPAGYYPAGGALVRGIAFGLGVAIAGGLWGDIDWNGGDIDIDIDRYNRRHVEHHLTADAATWRHDPAHREGVPYRDRVSRERYEHRLDGVAARDAFRGDEADRMRARADSRESMRQAGFAPASSHRQAVEDAGAAAREAQRARDHEMAALGARDSAREQARVEAVQRERQQAAERERALFPEREREQAAQRQRAADYQRAQFNERERQAARQRYADEQHRRARENAFDGVRQGQASREYRDGGRAAQRPSGSRGGGQPVSRPSRR